MYVVIDSNCDTVPQQVTLLNSQGTGLLNFLLALGYDPAHPPLAQLLKKAHHLKGDWLILTPVYWEAGHNDAMIVAQGKDLNLQDSEAKSWFELFARYLAEEGRTLYYHNAETWLMSDDGTHALNAKPVHHVLNCSLMPELAQLGAPMYWQKLITETQMLCASRPNSSSMNGLWIWGGAVLKEKMHFKVCTTDSFLQQAQICSLDVTLYQPKLKLKDYQILIINEFSQLSEQHQEELKSLPAYWYWNNTAYTIPSQRWFARLWRKLTHAH